MANIEIYTKSWCSYSAAALALLKRKGLEYHHIDVTEDQAKELEMIQRANAHTVPQLFIAGKSIGGYDDLAALENNGELDVLLAETESYNEQIPMNGVKHEQFQSTH